MFRFLIAFGLMLTAAAPAHAQGEWRHEASGVSVPRTIGEMRLNQERDASGGGRYDMILQFGDSDTPVTLYVYRSAYPNPALWFERTRLAMNANVGSDSAPAAPRSFTLGGGSTPNGLREEIDLPDSSRARATAVAIAQHGQWIIKARVTSNQLDRRGVAERMDRLLDALRLSGPGGPTLPLVVPSPCSDTNRMAGTKVTGAQEARLAAAMATGTQAYNEARGLSGLAANPSAWCRETSEIPVQYGSIYRRRDGEGWVALMGDSGMAVAGHRLDVADGSGGAAYASTPVATRVAALYTGIPHPDGATVDAVPILVGEARGLAEIRVGGDNQRR